jgi:hypothetical protein
MHAMHDKEGERERGERGVASASSARPATNKSNPHCACAQKGRSTVDTSILRPKTPENEDDATGKNLSLTLPDLSTPKQGP